jgi:hypothetical protein
VPRGIASSRTCVRGSTPRRTAPRRPSSRRAATARSAPCSTPPATSRTPGPDTGCRPSAAGRYTQSAGSYFPFSAGYLSKSGVWSMNISRSQPADGPPGFVTGRNRGGTDAPVSRSVPTLRARVLNSASGVVPSVSTGYRLASSGTIAWYSVEIPAHRFHVRHVPAVNDRRRRPLPKFDLPIRFEKASAQRLTSRSIFRRCVLSNCSQFSRRINASCPSTRSERSYSHRRAPVDFPGPACPPHNSFRCPYLPQRHLRRQRQEVARPRLPHPRHLRTRQLPHPARLLRTHPGFQPQDIRQHQRRPTPQTGGLTHL